MKSVSCSIFLFYLTFTNTPVENLTKIYFDCYYMCGCSSGIVYPTVSLSVSTIRNPTKAPLKTHKQKIIKELEKVSHEYVRRRDGIDGEIRGYCFDCGMYAEGQQFQAGHFEPSGSCGALLRFHPHNMHGQRGGCNMKYQQERVKIDYTFAMLRKYGKEYVDFLRSLKNKTIKADDVFYSTLLQLYKEGDEKKIVDYLHSF